MKKRMLFSAVLLVVCCALLSGCMNANNEPVAPETTATPMANAQTASPAPNAGMDAMSSPNPNAGATVPYDWQAQAGAVEGRINLFSEIQECRVVVSEGTALVGVKFTGAYQGELTQRIRDMIAGEVMAVDTGVQVVAVTAEEADVQKIYALADQVRGGAAPADIKQQVDQIARNTTTLR